MLAMPRCICSAIWARVSPAKFIMSMPVTTSSAHRLRQSSKAGPTGIVKGSNMRALKIGISLFALSLFAATAAQAGWQDVASQYDQKRLMQLQQSRAEGLSQAQHGRDMGAINEVLGERGRPIENVSGTWRCRQMKLGGMTPS